MICLRWILSAKFQWSISLANRCSLTSTIIRLDDLLRLEDLCNEKRPGIYVQKQSSHFTLCTFKTLQLYLGFYFNLKQYPSCPIFYSEGRYGPLAPFLIHYWDFQYGNCGVKQFPSLIVNGKRSDVYSYLHIRSQLGGLTFGVFKGKITVLSL